MNNKYTQSYLQCAVRLGLFFVVLFVICFLWYYIRPVEQQLHLSFFRMTFFGFNSMDAVGLIAGAIQSFIWGFIAVFILRLAGCCYCRKNN